MFEKAISETRRVVSKNTKKSMLISITVRPQRTAQFQAVWQQEGSVDVDCKQRYFRKMRDESTSSGSKDAETYVHVCYI